MDRSAEYQPRVRGRQVECHAAGAVHRRYRVVCILQPCPSRPLAICGLLFFEGLIDEGAQPGAEVEVPLGAEELETLTGFRRDADMK